MSSDTIIMQRKSFLAKMFSFFSRLFTAKEKPSYIMDANEAIDAETSMLWGLINNMEADETSLPEKDYMSIFTRSFSMLVNTYDAKELEALKVWPKYAKIAVHLLDPPSDELIHYVTEKNYVFLSRCLDTLRQSLYKQKDLCCTQRAERLSEAVYRHIVETIDPTDLPANLYLGKAAQGRGEYSEAETWFMRISDSEHGATALLACYEEETHKLRLNNRKKGANPHKKQIQEINQLQYRLYRTWIEDLKARLLNGADDNETKRSYVVFSTGYARFERYRGNYELAMDSLLSIPETYPEVYRIYQEEAMIYQFRPQDNAYYDLEKAVDEFRKAEAALMTLDPKLKNCKVAAKSILMPLANAYYQLGKYRDAEAVCNRVRKIDPAEPRVSALMKELRKKLDKSELNN